MTTTTETPSRSKRTRTVLLYAAVFSAFMVLISLLVVQGIQMNREGFKSIEIVTVEGSSGSLNSESIQIATVDDSSGSLEDLDL